MYRPSSANPGGGEREARLPGRRGGGRGCAGCPYAFGGRGGAGASSPYPGCFTQGPTGPGGLGGLTGGRPVGDDGGGAATELLLGLESCSYASVISINFSSATLVSFVA